MLGFPSQCGPSSSEAALFGLECGPGDTSVQPSLEPVPSSSGATGHKQPLKFTFTQVTDMTSVETHRVVVVGMGVTADGHGVLFWVMECSRTRQR